MSSTHTHTLTQRGVNTDTVEKSLSTSEVEPAFNPHSTSPGRALLATKLHTSQRTNTLAQVARHYGNRRAQRLADLYKHQQTQLQRRCYCGTALKEEQNECQTCQTKAPTTTPASFTTALRLPGLVPPLLTSNPSPIQRLVASPTTLQRLPNFRVTRWEALRLTPPQPANAADNRLIAIADPSVNQIQINGEVVVNGGPGENCADYKIGTTQTAWIGWVVAHYRGRNPGEGTIRVEHRPPMPMRDPGIGGDVWYNPSGSNVISPSACGVASPVNIRHVDGPWHSVPKARNNSAVPGSPLNFLRSYSRGLHLVTYLTAQDGAGNFLPRPLKFVYWNALQDFHFRPNFANPRLMWDFSGRNQINIGSKGNGAVGDAPYFTTSGAHFNDNFLDAANWHIREAP